MKEHFEVNLRQALEASIEMDKKELWEKINKNEIGYTQLNEGQIRDLSNRIQTLPAEDITILLSRYYFGFSYADIDRILEINHAEEIAIDTLHMLAVLMELGDTEIHEDSVKAACKLAGSEYTKFDEMRKWTRHIPTITKYAAMIVLAITITFSATLAINADLRTKFFHWVVQTFEEYSSFTTDVTQEEIDEMEPVDFSQYEVHYIPEGFELKERNVFHNSISYYYIGQNEESILILIESRDTIINSDTENATMNEITYKNNPAYWWTKEGITHLIWQQDDLICKITAHQTIEETMKIADSIKKS